MAIMRNTYIAVVFVPRCADSTQLVHSHFLCRLFISLRKEFIELNVDETKFKA